MNRTLEDYDSTAKREMVKAKQEEAMMYVDVFRSLQLCLQYISVSRVNVFDNCNVFYLNKPMDSYAHVLPAT